jgi:DNA-binding XRE family transcriptional regulator
MTSLALDPARLREARLSAGLTQKQLAARVGVHPITMTRYETGQICPRPPIVSRLASALRCKISDLANISS